MGFFDDLGNDLEQGFQGALGGGMAGLATGNPWVALGGAGLGFLGGALGNQGAGGYQDMLKKMATQFSQRQAPQMGQPQRSGFSQFRTNQAGLISQLESMARGEGPSAATQMMKQAMDQEAAAQASAAAGAGGRGVNAGAALRQASNNTAALQSQNARDTGLMRVQEQLGATQQLGSAIAQGRAADESTNMFNAGQANDVMRQNLEAKLRTMGINDQAQLQSIMAAIGVAGPGMGTQLLGGGASAMPYIAQLFGKSKSAGYSPYGSDVGSMSDDALSASPAVPA